MRLLLFTGNGGAGTTTMAAATAVHVARTGHKTLLLSTDRSAGVDGAWGGERAAESEHGLSVERVDHQDAVEAGWATLSGPFTAALGRAGGRGLDAAELTVPPGVEDLVALAAIRDAVHSARFDVVVCDCGPSTSALRLLSLPATLRWYLERLVPTHHRVLASLVAGRSRPLLAAAGTAETMLRDVAAVLGDRRQTSVRLVLTPQSASVDDARRTRTALALFGHPVGSVIVNRVVPAGGDPWRARWAASQDRVLAGLTGVLPDVTVRSAAYLDHEPVGTAALHELAGQVYGAADPVAAEPTREPTLLRRLPDVADEPRFELFVDLPGVRREDARLARSGDDLVVTAAGYRRLLPLPSVARRCRVVAAEVTGAGLRVEFAPDPALWPAP